eukprot:jgi/Galph1/1200/GphlegSOOS_G6036.1
MSSFLTFSIYLFLFAFIFLVCQTTGHLNYLDQFPNGAKVMDPDRNITSWIGVGHQDAKGMTGINQFGRDFHKVGGNWRRLCVLDSDGDGQTNGMELGDPCCVWKEGDVPFRSWDISHPGSKASVTRATRPICPGENFLSRTLTTLYSLHMEDSILIFYGFCTCLFLHKLISNRVYFLRNHNDSLGIIHHATSSNGYNVLSLWCQMEDIIRPLLDFHVAVFLIFQFILCRYLYFCKYNSLKSPLIRSVGELGICNLGLLLFPTSRNSPLWVMLGTSFEKALPYHRMLGYWTLFLTSWHALGMFESYAYLPRGISFLFSFSSNNVRFNLPGIYAYLFFVLIGICSQNTIRRNAFEIFYYAHLILFPLVLIFTILHVGFAGYYLAPGLVIQALDYFFRVHRTYNLTPLKIRVFQDAVRITLLQPKKWKAESCGDFAFFQIPYLAWQETHPFSIFSLDPATFDIVVKRRRRCSFTDKLHQACQGYSPFYTYDELIQQFHSGIVKGDESIFGGQPSEEVVLPRVQATNCTLPIPLVPRTNSFHGLKEEFAIYLQNLYNKVSLLGSQHNFVFHKCQWHFTWEQHYPSTSKEIEIYQKQDHNAAIESTPLTRDRTVSEIVNYDSFDSLPSTEALIEIEPHDSFNRKTSKYYQDLVNECLIATSYQREESSTLIFPKITLNQMVIRVQGPYGHLSINPFDFSSILLCAGGVGITGMLSILGGIYRSSKRHVFLDITLYWILTEVGQLEWVQDSLLAIKEDDYLKQTVHYEIYVTKGNLTASEDYPLYHVTTFHKGRPNWNQALSTWKQRSLLQEAHEGAVYICGPPLMVSQVQKHCISLENEQWRCVVSTEAFEF